MQEQVESSSEHSTLRSSRRPLRLSSKIAGTSSPLLNLSSKIAKIVETSSPSPEIVGTTTSNMPRVLCPCNKCKRRVWQIEECVFSHCNEHGRYRPALDEMDACSGVGSSDIISSDIGYGYAYGDDFKSIPFPVLVATSALGETCPTGNSWDILRQCLAAYSQCPGDRQ